MKEKTIKLVNLASAAFRIMCFLLALILLLIPFTVTIEETVWAVPPGSYRQKVTSESDFTTKNFFSYISYLKFWDCSATEETLFVVALVINLLLAVGFACVEAVFRKIYDSKVGKIVTIALSVLPIVALVMAIAIQADTDVWKMVGHERLYLSGYATWNIYKETLIMGNANLIFPIIMLVFATMMHIASGILNFLLPKKTDVGVEAVAEAGESVMPSVTDSGIAETASKSDEK